MYAKVHTHIHECVLCRQAHIRPRCPPKPGVPGLHLSYDPQKSHLWLLHPALELCDLKIKRKNSVVFSRWCVLMAGGGGGTHCHSIPPGSREDRPDFQCVKLSSMKSRRPVFLMCQEVLRFYHLTHCSLLSKSQASCWTPFSPHPSLLVFSLYSSTQGTSQKLPEMTTTHCPLEQPQPYL